MSAITAPALRIAPPPLAIRFVAFVALALYGAVHWAGQIEPARPGRMLAMVVVGGAGAIAVRAAGGLPRRARIAAMAGLLVAIGTGVLVASGVPLRLLWPDEWGTLVAGLGDGIATLPGVRIPYRGADEWTRVVLLAGGGAFIALAGALALWPGTGRPLSAAVVLGCFYAVPIVERDPGSPYLDGFGFAVLLAAFLWAERLRRHEAGLAAALLLSAAAVALLVAPLVDARRPWLDYEQIAESLESNATARFEWNHRYAPLDWPRDGKEMLRVKAPRAAYWKAVALEEFDGRGWRQAGDYNPAQPDTEVFNPGRWSTTLAVQVKGLRSRQYVSAGSTLTVAPTTGLSVLDSTPGTFVTGRRPLRRGDTYRTRAHVPTPDEQQLRDAGTSYPDFVRRQLQILLPRSASAPPTAGNRRPVVVFPSWSSEEPTFAMYEFGYRSGNGVRAVRDSPYRRVYDLAQRIKNASTDPYDFVRRVERRVRNVATYSERPPVRRYPLDAFLFRDKTGYCQQFSGAMALILRMAGVPARVAAGFTPGTLDKDTGDYVVRDIDAHSWVEAYFPGIGWMPFDPTPADAPARSQATSASLPNAGGADVTDAGGAGDRGSDPRAAGAEADRGGVSPWLAAGGPLLALAALLRGVALVRRRRAARAARAIPAELDELHRALTRSGREPARQTTLAELERLLGSTPAAAGYVRLLRESRFGARSATPGPRDRRALRRALGEGLGWGGRLRAWWALPPRPRDALRDRRRRAYTG